MQDNWEPLFNELFNEGQLQTLNHFLDIEYENNKVYPPRELVYNAFDLTPPSKVKAVIIGQDPYHNEGEAMGLCFSVPKGIPLPPSLKNIYREIKDDINADIDYSSGDLTCWAKRGVLLLNAYLTVRKNEPLSHKRKEYDYLLKETISYLESLNQPIVYLLWGGFAKKFSKYVTNVNHLVISANHPSPLSANRGGWFGCKCFSKANEFLISRGVSPIDWSNK